MARVLVGVMTRNRLHFARETILSVLAQRFTDFRLVVSENPTTPDAARALQDWLATLGDPRVEYVLQPIDGGEYGQGRALVARLRDEPYLCFMHDDDVMGPDYLATAVAALDKVVERLRHHGCTVQVVGLNEASAVLIDRMGS